MMQRLHGFYCPYVREKRQCFAAQYYLAAFFIKKWRITCSPIANFHIFKKHAPFSLYDNQY
ncbi:hypothetical protein KL86DPRO_10785 [uncultured delta proteobacterium]|uniref:Uncharacterized protein n=1 Tax=uncultured delta proteobacterium TaxID=34034 RepID=A0A212J652_9DELT|nr:hypothetical protein KL86DPRO_10785 [uncultured delta proteobacterium]